MTAANPEPVKSPCTSVCKMDDRTGWCLGCMRTIDEIAGWSVLDEAARRRICEALDVRRHMNATKPHSHAVRFGRTAPTISVADIDRALRFYTGVLGFTKVFENGSPVGFVILEKDAAEVHLSLFKNHKATVQNVAHLTVQDAGALFTHLEQHQVRIVKAIRETDFDLRCFVFADPDGNRIDVGQGLQVHERPDLFEPAA